MKKHGFILIIASFLAISCSDWLSVTPKTEKPTDILFQTQNGFRDALTGAYIEMSEDDAYGEHLTMGKIEYLTNFWDAAKDSGEEALTLHQYNNSKAEDLIASFYGRLYKVILAVNSILEHIDERQSIFSPGVYETIKGECLALRAYCHLDLLRLFGPVPIPSQITDKPILSYVTSVTKELHTPVSFSHFEDLLMEDLVNADTLLRRSYEMQNEITDDYFKYRNIRMNYPAIKALEARAYLWFGNKEKAFECAMTVIRNYAGDNNPLFRLGTAADMSGNDFALTKEQIFALYRFDLYKKYTSLFRGEKLYKGTKETVVKRDLYGSTGTDIREQNLWEQVIMPNRATFYVMKKYQVFEVVNSSQPDFKYIPLIRLSEMYLTAIESGPIETAQNLWNQFLSSRNLNPYLLPSDPEEFRNALISEFRKEFYAEGQVFYLYKRMNLTKEEMLWNKPNLEVNYILPLPKTEITY